jgi:hypothetical protein
VSKSVVKCSWMKCGEVLQCNGVFWFTFISLCIWINTLYIFTYFYMIYILIFMFMYSYYYVCSVYPVFIVPTGILRLP